MTSRSSKSGGNWVTMPTDTNTRAGRQAAYDMRRLRSDHGDAAVQKHSPWHQKNAPAAKKASKKKANTGIGNVTSDRKSKAKPKKKTSKERVDKAVRDAGGATEWQ